MSVLKSRAPWVLPPASPAVTCTLSALKPQVALLLVLPRLHLGLGQRTPAACPHHSLCWSLSFHIEIEQTVQVTHGRERQKNQNNNKLAVSNSCPLLSFLLIISRNKLKLKRLSQPLTVALQQQDLSFRRPMGSDSYCHRPAVPSLSRERTAA